MTKETANKIFDSRQIRSVWDADQGKWFFSIIDVIEVLTGTDRPRKYWSELKSKLKKEGSELSEKIGQLKLMVNGDKIKKLAKYVKIVNMIEKPMFIRRKIDTRIQEYLKMPEILARQAGSGNGFYSV